jgi:hypothetical protein
MRVVREALGDRPLVRLLSTNKSSRSKKLSTGAGHSPQSMLQTQPHQLEIPHGFEKKEGEAQGMVENGPRRPQIVCEEEDAGADDRPPPQAFGRRGAAKGLCRGHFLEPEEAAPAQAGEINPVSKQARAPRRVKRRGGKIVRLAGVCRARMTA